MTPIDDPHTAFIKAACVPLDAWHASGTLEQAQAILAAHPEVAGADIYTASILGDDAAVRRFLDENPNCATAKGGPHGWDPLTHLCFSRFLRLDRARSAGFVRATEALLDAGASANTGWFETNHQPNPEWESAIYGAAGIAHHPELTRLLLARGADPNDNEVPYHAPETHDNAALHVLVESGQLNADSLETMLLRKADWHDHDGIAYLLEHGADPNRQTRWPFTALHQALRRDNGIRIIELMLDHGADPALESHASGQSAIAMAARRGRGDVLDLLERRGVSIELRGVERLIAACARNDGATVRSIADAEPQLVKELVTEGGTLLARFAGNANTDGLRHLLDLGVDIAARDEEGDPYFDVARGSTALHVAAWRAWHETVRFLIERHAPIDALDGKGRSPLALAVRACVDSYWTSRRSGESVEALLKAGASTRGVAFPSGYADVDELLRLKIDDAS
jgi:ankyrin repeat protein